MHLMQPSKEIADAFLSSTGHFGVAISVQPS